MTHFVAWCPQTSGVTTSTQTVLHWQIITGYFTTGLLDKTTSIDLDEKNKSTTVRVIPPVSNSSKARVTSPEEKRINHNKPDWVITYYALRPIRITRVCMVLEAKAALEWKTAMTQIIVYLMKSAMTDGCTMGLIVAGTEWRFLYWDGSPGKDRHLFMVVKKSLWSRSRGPSSMTWKAVSKDMKLSMDEWNISSDLEAEERNLSLRNLYRIFTHLERNVQTMVASQQRGQPQLSFDGCPPDLGDALHIEITDVWPNLPGSNLPPTNGVSVDTIYEEVEPEVQDATPAPTAARSEDGMPGGAVREYHVDDETDGYAESTDSAGHDALLDGHAQEDIPYVLEIAKLQGEIQRGTNALECQAWVESVATADEGPFITPSGSVEAPEIQASVRPTFV